MTLFQFCPDYSLDDTWLLFEDNDSGRLVARAEYRDLVCKRCGKLDEFAAINGGIVERIAIRTKRDWTAMSDDWICVSDRFRQHVMNEGFSGVNFCRLGQSDYWLLMCDCLVPTDEKLAGFQNIDLCVVCGRYRERIVGPLLKGMVVPDSENTFFASEIANENIRVRYWPIFGSEKIKNSLINARMKGIEFLEPL